MKDKIRLVLINMAVTSIIILGLNLLSCTGLFMGFVVQGIRMLLVAKSNELPNYDNNREMKKVYDRRCV